MGASAILAEFAAEAGSARIPERARALARDHVLDCVGVTLAASVEAPGRIVAELTREAGGRPEAHLLGTDIVGSAIEVAWANGTLAHLLDFDDTGFSHPTACILPAALAIGERVGASGGDLLRAMVIGYEVFERLAVAARPYESRLRGRGYHPTSIYGCPAAAAAAGCLLGLDARRMNAALGLAATNAGGLTQHFGSWGKGVQAGNAARAGVSGALLAAKGYRCDAEVFEGTYGLFNAIHGLGNYDLGAVAEGLGERWAIVEPGLSIKRYPCCGGTLRAIDAAIALREEHGISFQQVERVVVECAPELLDILRFRAPGDGFRGKFSLDYCVAAAVLDGRVDLDTFGDDYATSPRLRAALERVVVVQRPEWSATVASRKRTPVTIQLEDGRSLSQEVEHPRGSPGNPLSREELLAKFRACASRALPGEQVARGLELLAGLERVGDLGELSDALAVEALARA